MVQILQTRDTQILENNKTSRISITGDWPEILRMQPGDPIKLALANGKHGLHLVAYNNQNQPKIEENEKHLEEIILNATEENQ